MNKGESGNSLTWEIFDLLNSIKENEVMFAKLKLNRSKKFSGLKWFLKRQNDVDVSREINEEIYLEIDGEITKKDKSKAKQRLKEALLEFILKYYKEENKEEKELDELLWQVKALSSQGFSRVFYHQKMLDIDAKIKALFSEKGRNLDAGVFARYIEQYVHILRNGYPEFDDEANTNYSKILILLSRIYGFSGKELTEDIKPEFTPYLIYEIVGRYCYEKNKIDDRLKAIENEIQSIRHEKSSPFGEVESNNIRLDYLKTEKLLLCYKQGISYYSISDNDKNMSNKTLGYFLDLLFAGTENNLFIKKEDIYNVNIAQRLELNRILQACYLSDCKTVLSLTKEVIREKTNSEIESKLYLIEIICELKLKDTSYLNTFDQAKRKIRNDDKGFDYVLIEYLKKSGNVNSDHSEFINQNSKFKDPFSNAIFALLVK